MTRVALDEVPKKMLFSPEEMLVKGINIASYLSPPSKAKVLSMERVDAKLQAALKSSEERKVTKNLSKPVLERPKISLVSLYFILDKIGTASENASYAQEKTEIEVVNALITEARQQMKKEIEKATSQAEESKRWGIAIKVFSWIGSLVGLIAGAVLIATGAGAVAGAMLIAGGVIAIANQIMELSGGWDKILATLPGEDTAKKQAIVSWMQIGIMVLCVVLSGVGIISGGITAFGEGMQTASSFLGAIGTAGGAVTKIGEGVSESRYNTRRGEQKRIERRIAELKYQREDGMDRFENIPNILKDISDSLARNFHFLEEINAAFQRAWR